jgi:hypothetical protein
MNAKLALVCLAATPRIANGMMTTVEGITPDDNHTGKVSARCTDAAEKVWNH